MTLQTSTIIDLINAGVCGYLAVRLHRGWQQDPSSQTLKSFFMTYIFMTLAYVFLFVPRLLASSQTQFLGVSFALGNGFFLLATAYFGRIVVFFTRPNWAKRFFFGFLGLAAISFIWSLLQPAKPMVDAATGITSWNVQAAVGVYTGVLMILVLIPGAIFFIHRGWHEKINHVVRVRSITIGVGAALIMVTAITFYLASTETIAILGDLFSIAALLTVFLGVVYHRPQKLPPPAITNKLS